MKPCSTCKQAEPRKGQRTCMACHRNYMRDWNSKKKKVSHETINEPEQKISEV